MLRFSLRSLRNTPAFTTVVVLTLGVGIGAATAMFSVVNGLLLNPLPYPDADRLVMLWQGRRGQDVEEDWFSVAQYVDIREQTTAFDDVTLAVGFGATLTERGAPSRVGFVRTTSVYLGFLGARASLGRIFDETDDAGGAPTVALITDEIWRGPFGGDPGVVGQTITLDGTQTEIVGVLSADVLIDNEVLPTLGAVDPLGVILSLPLTEELLAQRNREDYNIVGRLRVGATVAQAQSQLDQVASQIQTLHETDPNSGFFIRALPLLDEVVGGVRRTLIMLLAAVGVLLLIACGNVANLLFSRGTARRRELSIRAAIGAGRQRLIRESLAESAILSAAGASLGVLVATGGVMLLRRIGSASLPRLGDIVVDGSVLTFAGSLAVVTCLVFGLLPAVRTSQIQLADVMKQGARGSVGGGALWSGLNLSSALVTLEVALSLVLLIGGGLLGRSLLAIQDVDPGFEAQSRLTFRIQLGGPEFPADRRESFLKELSADLEALPGVEAVGAVSFIPFGGNLAWTPVTIPTYMPPDGSTGEFISSVRIATPSYFETLGIPILRGRTFEEDYSEDAQRAVIIDEQMAERYFEGRDPIGQSLRFLSGSEGLIIGVVGSIKHTKLDDPSRFTTYLAHPQAASGNMALVVHTLVAPEELIRPATDAVHALDPNVAVVDVATMEERLAASLSQRRFSMFLLQVFSAVALFLASIGIYGLVSSRVSQGARELGMRMALGAQHTSILRLVLGHGMRLSIWGTGLGILGAIGTTRLMRTMLFDVSTVDPATYILMGGALTAVTLLACLIPALRATRVDVLEVLRAE